MKKRLFSVLLALVLVLGCLPVVVQAEGAGNPVTFKEGESQEVTISRVTGNLTEDFEIVGRFSPSKSGFYRVVCCATVPKNLLVDYSSHPHFMGISKMFNDYEDIGFMDWTAYKGTSQPLDEEHILITSFDFAPLKAGKSYQIGYENNIIPGYESKFSPYSCKITIFSADDQISAFNADGTAPLTTSAEEDKHGWPEYLKMDGTNALELLYRPAETGWYTLESALTNGSVPCFVTEGFGTELTRCSEKFTAVHMTAGKDYYVFCPFGVFDALSMKKTGNIPTILTDESVIPASFMSIGSQFLALFTPDKTGYYAPHIYKSGENQQTWRYSLDFFNETTGESVPLHYIQDDTDETSILLFLEKDTRYSVKLSDDFSESCTFQLEWQGETDPNPPIGSDPDDNPIDDTPIDTKFTDIPANAFYADAVNWAVEKGITTGTDKNHFSPSMTCSRGQVVTFLWRAAGSPTPAGTAANFSDVKPGAYYEKAVQWAVEKGVTTGTGGNKFSPEVPCTRAQTVTFQWRAAGKPGAGASSFSDVAENEFYTEAVSWAVEKEITAGTGNNKFSPDKRCDRSQIVTFLYRAR